MTRKRCIKLIMARGYARNGAGTICAILLKYYGSYEVGYQKFCSLIEPSLQDFTTLAVEALIVAQGSLENAIKLIAETIEEVCGRFYGFHEKPL